MYNLNILIMMNSHLTIILEKISPDRLFLWDKLLALFLKTKQCSPNRGALHRHLPESTPCLNVNAWMWRRGHVLGVKSQAITFQVCLQRLKFTLNTCHHTTLKLVMSGVQSPRQRGNLNLPYILKYRIKAYLFEWIEDIVNIK